MSIYRGKTKKDIYLASLLYDAIEDCDIRSVKTLLSVKGADPNLILPKTKISPFHLVIGNDSENFAYAATVLLLQHGGNPNVQSDDGLTPIHIAAAWGRYEILKLLLACGGDPEIRDVIDKTALHYATEGNFVQCSEYLKWYSTYKDGILLREKEDRVRYQLKLEKILVNNGTIHAGYEIVNEYNTDNICDDIQRLKNLPESNSKEYVMTWFNSLNKSNPVVIENIQNTERNVVLTDNFEDSLKESDEECLSTVTRKDICFRKAYKKRVKCRKGVSIKNSYADASEMKQFSCESGVSFLSDPMIPTSKSVQRLPLDANKFETTSDYLTCTSGDSPDILERNIFDFNTLITNDDSNKSIRTQTSKTKENCSSELSFVSISEVYKYEDKEENIVLYERRFLKNLVSDDSSLKSSVRSDITSKDSVVESIDFQEYDLDTIRRELTLLGYNPGPITVTTKRVYLKKLKQLQKLPTAQVHSCDTSTRVYSLELEKTLQQTDWFKDIAAYKTLEETVCHQFSHPDPTRKWREGNNKSSFTYLLLDPRITNNLPLRAENLTPKEVWKIFLSAVFYVGKGKRSRPYNHLYEAVNLWNAAKRNAECKKLNQILDIWKDNSGVVCLHLFQNTIPVEAYTREAAIIDALKLENLCNVKPGNFYGLAATWSRKEKQMLGVYLLYKAMMIFLNEGERQLCPEDIN